MYHKSTKRKRGTDVDYSSVCPQKCFCQGLETHATPQELDCGCAQSHSTAMSPSLSWGAGHTSLYWQQLKHRIAGAENQVLLLLVHPGPCPTPRRLKEDDGHGGLS